MPARKRNEGINEEVGSVPFGPREKKKEEKSETEISCELDSHSSFGWPMLVCKTKNGKQVADVVKTPSGEQSPHTHSQKPTYDTLVKGYEELQFDSLEESVEYIEKKLGTEIL